jgi:hypothetical protein
MGDWLRREMPVVFEWWFLVVVLIVLAVEIAAALYWLPPDRLLPDWYLGVDVFGK